VERVLPDIILIDAVMPGMDGFEACRRMKRNPALAAVPIVFMTGLTESEDVVRGLEAGGVDYVTKPLALAEVVALLAGVGGDDEIACPWVADWLAEAAEPVPGQVAAAVGEGPVLQFVYVGRMAPDEVLFRIVETRSSTEEARLRDRLGLTAREAEVLLWIGHGKGTRDIAEILGMSPRTVQKHLEQIYSKLGVENRAAAAAIAIRSSG
jgi:DNA-binding NarL/FixJ family response regulator